MGVDKKMEFSRSQWPYWDSWRFKSLLFLLMKSNACPPGFASLIHWAGPNKDSEKIKANHVSLSEMSVDLNSDQQIGQLKRKYGKLYLNQMPLALPDHTFTVHHGPKNFSPWWIILHYYFVYFNLVNQLTRYMSVVFAG